MTPPATTTTLAEPAFDVLAELEWFVSVLDGAGLSEDEYELRFSEAFRREVAHSTVEPIIADALAEAPYTITQRLSEGSAGAVVVESALGTELRIAGELDADGRFVALLIQPTESPTLENPPDTAAEAFDRLATLGEVRALTAEVSAGECAIVDSVRGEEPAPLGSVFKLYVLGALSASIAQGDLNWDDTITAGATLESIPPGQMQNLDPGSEVPLADAAELMISISDNTASDHLIEFLGREGIEARLPELGNTGPGLNTPFLTTRELTALKVGPASGLRDPQWIDGDEATRRSILDQISDVTIDDLPLADWTDPVDPHLVEWFASPNDLCSLALSLLTLNEADPEIGRILAQNPGIPDDDGLWDSIWFKGGSEPGLAAAWWVTRSDDRIFLTTGSVVNPDETIDTGEAMLLLAAVRDLLAP